MTTEQHAGSAATKKQLLERLLEEGMVLVALDARAEGVDMPAHIAGDAQLRLNLSYRFGLPMEVSDWGVEATLTFSGDRCDCRIPWASIFLIVSHVTGQPYLFPEDIPEELLADYESSAEDEDEDDGEDDGDGDEAADREDDEAQASSTSGASDGRRRAPSQPSSNRPKLTLVTNANAQVIGIPSRKPVRQIQQVPRQADDDTDDPTPHLAAAAAGGRRRQANATRRPPQQQPPPAAPTALTSKPKRSRPTHLRLVK